MWTVVWDGVGMSEERGSSQGYQQDSASDSRRITGRSAQSKVVSKHSGSRVRLARDVRGFQAGTEATLVDASGLGWAKHPYIVQFDDGVRTNLAASDVEASDG